MKILAYLAFSSVFLTYSIMALSGVIRPKESIREGLGINGDLIHDAYAISTPTVTYKAYLSGSSVDPFASKTNKYAESKRILAVGIVDFNIKFGGSTIADATDSDFYVPAKTPTVFLVDDKYKYVRVIDNSTDGDIFLTELY